MLYRLYQSGRDIFVSLSDNYKREVYASFIIKVRDFQIIKYEFENYKLTPSTFSMACQFVSGMSLEYLKRNIGKSLSTDNNDFEMS